VSVNQPDHFSNADVSGGADWRAVAADSEFDAAEIINPDVRRGNGLYNLKVSTSEPEKAQHRSQAQPARRPAAAVRKVATL
jgi:hypothetical protein